MKERTSGSYGTNIVMKKLVFPNCELFSIFGLNTSSRAGPATLFSVDPGRVVKKLPQSCASDASEGVPPIALKLKSVQRRNAQLAFGFTARLFLPARNLFH